MSPNTIENNNILNIRLEIGNNQEPTGLTFDTLYIPDKEKYPELANINFNLPKRPFFHRYKKYKRSVLNAAGYPGVLVYFFDRRKFKEILSGTDSSSSANDDTLRENIYLTLYYLFPTGYPTLGNIHFSANKIAGGGMGFETEGGLGVLNFLKEPALTTGVPITVEKSWWQGIVETFQGKRIFSYVKLDKTYTISEAIWKNDMYNHPTYRKLLRGVYTYISWGLRYQKNRIMVGTKNENGEVVQKSVLKLDQQIEEVRKEFISKLRTFITDNYQNFCENATAYKNLRTIIVESKLLYLFSQILKELETKVSLSEKKIDKLSFETSKSRDDNLNKYDIRTETAKKNEYNKLITSIGTFFGEKDSKTIQEIKDKFLKINTTTKDATDMNETPSSVIEEQGFIDKIHYADKGYDKEPTKEDEISVQNIRQKYRDRGIIEELKYLKEYLSRRKKISTDNNSLLEKYAKYVFFLDTKEAIEQNKMVPIQTALLIDDKYYKNAFESGGELEPIKRLYNTDYREFQRELGGAEGTNPVLNRIIYDFLNGQSSELAECAIWFHHSILEDKSLLIEPDKLKEIESRVQTFNSNWQNIYTGIRAEYTTSQQLTSVNRESTSSKMSNDFTIYVCLNAFDQELNDETLEKYKCFINNHSIGDMSIKLLNNSEDTKEESIRDKYLIQSVIQKIPSPDNQSLKDKVKTSKEEDKKQPQPQRPPARRPGVPVAPMRQQGGKTFRPRPRPRHRTFRRRRPYFSPAT